MRKLHYAIMTAAVIAASGFGAGSLLAQDNTMQEPMEANGMQGDMMQGDGMPGMMGMMSEMSAMMEKCNAMMDKMQQDDSAS
ncbi:hypothetical protein [Billgrantia bachuensis]|uniref:Pentapeptide MXKDX repeat protein n=1 Tax=Billgrantia bachuensis TaxID=2717286 RepID=A0ABX0PN93_9GAMM|nr:hypothetical protein [Halomonas bachuensis]NIC04744.1 hypothetical protein [Halomonas bachuensis]